MQTELFYIKSGMADIEHNGSYERRITYILNTCNRVATSWKSPGFYSNATFFKNKHKQIRYMKE